MLKSQQLIGEMKEKWDGIKAIRDQVVDEEREYSQEERDTIEKTLDEVREIEIQVEKERKNESLTAEIDKFDDMFTAAGKKQQRRGLPPAIQQGMKNVSLGRQFVDSEVWQGWLKANAPGGQISVKGFTTPPIQIKSSELFGRKELITGTSDVSAGAFVVTDRTGIYEQIGRYPLTLRSLIDVRQTGSDLVEFVQQTRQVTQATPVAEANVTDYSGATGEVSGEKPEGTVRWLVVNTPVKTIAVWIPATTRALADANQLRGLIDSELRSDVNEELEDQLLNGNGVGENFTGLTNTPGVLVQAFNTDIARTARMAITNLLINGRQMPTAWLLNPQDWEAFDLLQDTNGQYYWGGPMRQGPPTLWGVPVAQSFFLTQGTGYLGNWRKMVLWDREQATIAVSDSHADFFIRNMVAIRCELRAAMGVTRPTGFVEMDLTSGS